MRTILSLLAVMLGLLSGRPVQAQSTEAILTRHCRAEWPGDAQMYDYCVRHQREAVAEKAILVRNSGGIPTSDFRTALAGCEAEWPRDFQMQVYCLKRQIEGYEDVARGPTSGMASPTSGERSQIQRHCANEWSEDFQMRAYCEKKQLEGLAYLKTSNSPLKGRCRREWPSDFSMQAYCVRRGDLEKVGAWHK